jgi:peroxiredoxin family protein
MAEAAPLGLILLDGTYERVHYGLAMAASALAVNRPAVLFFTNGALLALAGRDGWQRLGENALGEPATAQDTARIAAGVAGLEELLEACAALGGKFIACEMGLRTMGLAANDLRHDIKIEIAGLVTFYNALPAGAQPSVL